LFGIDSRFQNRGMGKTLLKDAVAWLEERGAKQVTVVTQGRNIKGLRLYQKCGFAIHSVKLWYHRWFNP